MIGRAYLSTVFAQGNDIFLSVRCAFRRSLQDARHRRTSNSLPSPEFVFAPRKNLASHFHVPVLRISSQIN
jgi:hypothetical protein